jgi:hypothetical protein
MYLSVSYTVTPGSPLFCSNNQHNLATSEFFRVATKVFSCIDATNQVSFPVRCKSWGVFVPLQAKILETTEKIRMKFGNVRLRLQSSDEFYSPPPPPRSNLKLTSSSCQILSDFKKCFIVQKDWYVIGHEIFIRSSRCSAYLTKPLEKCLPVNYDSFNGSVSASQVKEAETF